MGIVVALPRRQQVGHLDLKEVLKQNKSAEGDLVDGLDQSNVNLVEEFLEVYFGANEVLDLRGGLGVSVGFVFPNEPYLTF